MDVKELIDQYAAYDRWANTLFVERLMRESDEVLDRPVRSSFPSLRATLLHMRDAECAWCLRLDRLPPRWPADPSTAIGSVLPFVQAMHDRVRALTPDELQEEVDYHSLKGLPYLQQRLQMLMHAFNHSTYHRGQLVTMMRDLGLGEVPSTDLVTFQRILAGTA
ncbi:MAG TPA: DinB family protein [Flavobacteriales bacterium]